MGMQPVPKTAGAIRLTCKFNAFAIMSSHIEAYDLMRNYLTGFVDTIILSVKHEFEELRDTIALRLCREMMLRTRWRAFQPSGTTRCRARDVAERPHGLTARPLATTTDTDAPRAARN